MTDEREDGAAREGVSGGDASARRAAEIVADRAPGADDRSAPGSGEADETGAERARRKEAELIGE